MDVKNVTLSAIRGMRKCGSGVEFDVVVVERQGSEVREFNTTFCADGKFVTTYLQEFGKLERTLVPYTLSPDNSDHATAH